MRIGLTIAVFIFATAVMIYDIIQTKKTKEIKERNKILQEQLRALAEEKTTK